jgi:thiamine-monophosphate kinase
MFPGTSKALSEGKIIDFLRRQFTARSFALRKGIGDDAAVIHPAGADEDWIISTDMLIEGVDFQRNWASPGQLGHKALAVNLSDLAAMGAQPRFFTVALGIPDDVSERWIHAFFKGLKKLGIVYKALLIGGDLSRSPGEIQISITVLGESVHRKTTYRCGGKPGDAIYVTGTLGLASAGLRLLQRGVGLASTQPERRALAAQRMPRPRCTEGLWLAQSGYVRCMMDLSDGLSMDLPRLCSESGTGAEVNLSRLPVFKESVNLHFDPIELALHGGEDFELLFCVKSRVTAAFEAAYPKHLAPITCIGTLTANPTIVQVAREGTPGLPLIAAGFDHFRSRASTSRPHSRSARV